jgi:hypothetical protein
MTTATEIDVGAILAGNADVDRTKWNRYRELLERRGRLKPKENQELATLVREIGLTAVRVQRHIEVLDEVDRWTVEASRAPLTSKAIQEASDALTAAETEFERIASELRPRIEAAKSAVQTAVAKHSFTSIATSNANRLRLLYSELFTGTADPSQLEPITETEGLARAALGVEPGYMHGKPIDQRLASKMADLWRQRKQAPSNV